MLPCGSKPTSRRAAEDVLLRRRVRTRRDDGAIDGRRPAADHHQHLALRAELGDQVGAFVHRPDVVVLVDADRVREFEAVIALADFLDEGAVLVEFEQARRVAAVIDEDVALRVGGDGDRFAQGLSGRQLEEIRDGGEGDFRHARDRRLLLGGRGTGQEQDRGARGKKMSCHGREPIPGLPSVQSRSGGSLESWAVPSALRVRQIGDRRREQAHLGLIAVRRRRRSAARRAASAPPCAAIRTPLGVGQRRPRRGDRLGREALRSLELIEIRARQREARRPDELLLILRVPVRHLHRLRRGELVLGDEAARHAARRCRGRARSRS